MSMPDTGTSKDSCRPLHNLNLLCPSNIDRALSGVAEVRRMYSELIVSITNMCEPGLGNDT
jgi:hypothetical protein